METPSCVAILGILAEMARCLRENIGKVQLTPIDSAISLSGALNGANELTDGRQD